MRNKSKSNQKNQRSTKVTSLSKNKGLPKSMKVRFSKATNISNNGLTSCAPVLSSYDKKAKSGDGNYYALVIQRSDREWNFVSVNDGYLDISYKPSVFDKSEAEKLLELWERVVINNAIPWNDNVIPETMRIISYKLLIDDQTLHLFQEVKNENPQQVLAKSALAKLTDAEARALNLEHQITKTRLFFNPNFDNYDRQLLRDLADLNGIVEINEYLKNLSEN